MSDGEILRLAEELDSLTNEARTALRAELDRRGLGLAAAPEAPVAEPSCASPEPVRTRPAAKRSTEVTTSGVVLLLGSALLVLIALAVIVARRGDWFVDWLMGPSSSRMRAAFMLFTLARLV